MQGMFYGLFHFLHIQHMAIESEASTAAAASSFRNLHPHKDDNSDNRIAHDISG